jgi:KaiC/GvpD/RAD55 family RecA-like ATPase
LRQLDDRAHRRIERGALQRREVRTQQRRYPAKSLENEKRQRILEILKIRGAAHQKGEFPFTIDTVNGVTVAPICNLAVSERASTERTSVGVGELDQMCGGGILRDCFLLVNGPTGTGKMLRSPSSSRPASDRDGVLYCSPSERTAKS